MYITIKLVYGLNVEKVNTVNYIGAIKRAPKGGRFRERDFKKVYVTLNEDIEPFF
jgi:large subunit ribosomal protein L23